MSTRWQVWLVYGIFGCLLGGWLFFIHTHGFPTQDESWFLQAGVRLLNGELVYKDFQFTYVPGAMYLNAIAFQLLGVSILSSRLVAALISVAAVAGIWWLHEQWRWPVWLGVATIVGYIGWGPMQINFVWPVMLCLTTGILTGVFLTAARSRPHQTQWLVMAGISIAATLLFKQNFGLALVVATGCFFLMTGWYREWRKIGWMGLGFGYVLVAQLAYWLVTDSLSGFIADTRYLLIEKIIGQGILNSDLPWDYPAPLPTRVAKVFFYALPLLISIFSMWVIWRKRAYQDIFFPLLVGWYYLLSIRPTTDLVHLTPLIAISFIPLGLLYQHLDRSVLRKMIALIIVGLLTLGLYRGLRANYYRWDMPLFQQQYLEKSPVFRLWISPTGANSMQQLARFFAQYAADESEVFVYSYAPIIYLVTQKSNPTRFDYLHSGVLSPEIETEVITALEDRRLQYVVTNIPLACNHNQIEAYLLLHYQPVMTANEYSVWQRQSSTTETEPREPCLDQLPPPESLTP